MTAPSLVEFLHARIAEDYEAVRVEVEVGREVGFSDDIIDSHTAAGEWGPARVLAECEAKRRIVEDHRLIAMPEHHRKHISREDVPDRCGRCWADPGFEVYPCPTLRLLALPYAGHPDYRQEWKP